MEADVRRKLRQSCSRCREKKLKCDKESPCLECRKRNIGHLCIRDERQPRAKRRRRGISAHIESGTAADKNDLDAEEEMIQVLHSFIEGVSHAGALSSNASESVTGKTVMSDIPNAYWADNSLERIQEQDLLIAEIIEALPHNDVILRLSDVFAKRCQGPLGNIFHTPSYRKQIDQLCKCLDLDTLEAKSIAVCNTFTLDVLANHLLSLVLGLAFHPSPSMLAWTDDPISKTIEEMRMEGSAQAETWRKLAWHCLRDARLIYTGSIASLQASLMIVLDGQEEMTTLDSVLVCAITGARRLGLHRLKDASLSSTSDIDALIREEIGVRIWWAVVVRDWTRGQALGHYNVHANHFDTRIPLHINDDDLCMSSGNDEAVIERPRSEFTHLSYTIDMIAIATLIRENIDVGQNQRQAQVNRKLETLLNSLPDYYQMGNSSGLDLTDFRAAIPVQRWMLHQQIWALFLKLRRFNSKEASTTLSINLLAQSIIDTQAHLQLRCNVCRSLSSNSKQMFDAAVLLIFDVLMSQQISEGESFGAQQQLLVAQDKVNGAIELLKQSRDPALSKSGDTSLSQATSVNTRQVIILRELLELAATLTSKRVRFSDSTTHDSHSLSSLKPEVMRILRSIHNKSNSSTSRQRPRQSLNHGTSTLNLRSLTSSQMNIMPALLQDESNLSSFFDFESWFSQSPRFLG